MSIITKFLSVLTEPQFKLARDLTAMAIADGQVTPDEMEAMRTICHLEGVDEKKLVDALKLKKRCQRLAMIRKGILGMSSD